MYKNQLTVYGEHLAKAQSLPANASVEGNGGSRRAGALLGAAEIVMVAGGPVTIAKGATLTLSLRESGDDVVFAESPVCFRRTAHDAAMSFAQGDVMARLPLPSDAGKFVRVVVGTDDAGASGLVDIVFEYMPR